MQLEMRNGPALEWSRVTRVCNGKQMAAWSHDSHLQTFLEGFGSLLNGSVFDPTGTLYRADDNVFRDVDNPAHLSTTLFACDASSAVRIVTAGQHGERTDDLPLVNELDRVRSAECVRCQDHLDNEATVVGNYLEAQGRGSTFSRETLECFVGFGCGGIGKVLPEDSDVFVALCFALVGVGG